MRSSAACQAPQHRLGKTSVRSKTELRFEAEQIIKKPIFLLDLSYVGPAVTDIPAAAGMSVHVDGIHGGILGYGHSGRGYAVVPLRLEFN